MLSIIIPAYNEEQMIEHTAHTIKAVLEKDKIENELIFVNDGSKDKTWEKICQVSEKVMGVRGISFSRNFGKEAAMLAGLESALGDACVVMDCDLQHPPEKIAEMYHLWEQGYQVIEGVKSDRGKENVFHRTAAGIFYGIISRATGVDMRNTSDFKLLDRQAVDEILRLPEAHFFFRALSSWIGFRTASVEYEVAERAQGTSKWSLTSLVKYALTNITSFSTAPLQLVTVSGVLFLIFAVIIGIQTIIRFIMGNSMEGFTTVILLQLISSSIIMVAIGLIGYYIAKIYDEVRQRPRYIISEQTDMQGADADAKLI